MSLLKLPKPYLSYSQWTLWRRNKEGYRARYYRNEPQHETPEMTFGKQVATLLEDTAAVKDDPILSRLGRYKQSEYAVDTIIGDVPVIAKIDAFDDELNAFQEFKTGHANKDGKIPWSPVSVRKHEQLPFYSALIETSCGTVIDLCHLLWLETQFKKGTMEFDGHILEGGSRELELTGRIEVFPRIIRKWERKRMREMIISTAHEISDDFEAYTKAGA